MRKGYSMSPSLFSVYTERINSIKYKNDQAVLGNTMERIVAVGIEFGMKINVGKTKIMSIILSAFGNVRGQITSKRIPLHLTK